MTYTTDSQRDPLDMGDLCRRLATTYEHGPSLIVRLDDPELRTTQPLEEVLSGHSKPGSKPPVQLDAASWSRSIKEHAITLNKDIRRSTMSRPWAKAILDLPAITPEARWSEVHRVVGRWYSTCRTVLGFQIPSALLQNVRCFVCDQATIRARNDGDKDRAWCTNPECVDDAVDGKPARYEGVRLSLLLVGPAKPQAA